ncbi:hypothetical protein BN8_02834 [Fibrisoma limi BUZ 3]|uniref:Outer membrane protein beta-barrel domain-containing protein n=1 Tax=Fibrisoma limi BUZ 3 TaxID=1185876 RepID=I2GIJ3_9BACT|nr:hypothetical protein [Fibrisoma limi]CCH53718.1 hypothetical protein BN8_02834 [Fibrisoma limi BUZ 3]
MKKHVFICLLVVASQSALAQQPLRYTIWADGVLNAQLPKSNLYGLGAGLRAEVSMSLRSTKNAFFTQVGYTRFFEKEAFTANIGLLNVGYRYQVGRAFSASLGVGAQYWRERMRVRFPDYVIDETFTNILPSATVGLGWRIKTRYHIGLENRVLFKPENGRLSIRDNVALSLGYTL